jgi:hypothetical protein
LSKNVAKPFEISTYESAGVFKPVQGSDEWTRNTFANAVSAQKIAKPSLFFVHSLQMGCTGKYQGIQYHFVPRRSINLVKEIGHHRDISGTHLHTLVH